MVAVRRREGHRTRWSWPMVVLVLAVITSGAAVSWMVVNSARSTSAIRFDAEKALLIARMEDAVQVESQYAGHVVGQLSGDADPHAMGGMSMSGVDTASAPGVLLGDAAVALQPRDDLGTLLRRDERTGLHVAEDGLPANGRAWPVDRPVERKRSARGEPGLARRGRGLCKPGCD